MFLNCPPTLSPSYIMHQIKGYTSKILREEFNELKMPNLWTRSYLFQQQEMCAAGNNQKVCRRSKEKILKENIILESEVSTMSNFIVEFPLKTENIKKMF